MTRKADVGDRSAYLLGRDAASRYLAGGGVDLPPHVGSDVGVYDLDSWYLSVRAPDFEAFLVGWADELGEQIGQPVRLRVTHHAGNGHYTARVEAATEWSDALVRVDGDDWDTGWEGPHPVLAFVRVGAGEEGPCFGDLVRPPKTEATKAFLRRLHPGVEPQDDPARRRRFVVLVSTTPGDARMQPGVCAVILRAFPGNWTDRAPRAAEGGAPCKAETD